MTMDSSQPSDPVHTTVQFPADWSVPNFRVDFWDGKNKDFCVVVPVINEGERFRRFARRLSDAGIPALADIFIVDGGSTDHSLDPAFLRSCGVRGLLTKIDSGKLSAQLRVAYAYALGLNYQGVITIDGNDKDDPAAIPGFVTLLRQGYDFVQASRFIKGGKHENTPRLRYLAIRLLHAPLLSLASGFAWTDTTQGFRGYSSHALLHDDVKPFRDIFQDYELLAYLSYRLPSLGMACIESPTTRLYPKGETPTKISAVRGSTALIRTLLKACLGRFNP